VRLAWSLKAALLTTGLAALSGCADTGPMQAQIDEIRLELEQLKQDTGTANKMANKAAANGSTASVQKEIRQVQSATQDNAMAIAALSDKLDRMFKRPLAKQAAAEQ
jgi:hypothetical protein